MYLRYRAKGKFSKVWKYGSFVTFLTSRIVDTPVPTSKIIDKLGIAHNIDEKTLGMYINYTDSYDVDIYTGDIIKFGTFATYLIWYCNEMQCLEAVRLDRGKVYCNKPSDTTNVIDWDYHNSDYFMDYTDFCVMLQDPYGDFQGPEGIEIIGNIFDNPELVKVDEQLDIP